MGKVKNVLKAIQAYFMYYNPPSADIKQLTFEEEQKIIIEKHDTYLSLAGKKIAASDRALKRFRAAEKHRKQHNRRKKRELFHNIIRALME